MLVCKLVRGYFSFADCNGRAFLTPNAGCFFETVEAAVIVSCDRGGAYSCSVADWVCSWPYFMGWARLEKTVERKAVGHVGEKVGGIFRHVAEICKGILIEIVVGGEGGGGGGSGRRG